MAEEWAPMGDVGVGTVASGLLADAISDLCRIARERERVERSARGLLDDLRKVALAAQIAALGRDRLDL